MTRLAWIALLLSLASCGAASTSTSAPTPKTEPPRPAPQPAEPAVADSSATPCPDAEITKKVDDCFSAIELYFGEMAQHTPAWTDCEVARKDLLALEPLATSYVAQVTELQQWGQSHGEACKTRFQELVESKAAERGLEKRFGSLEGQVTEVLKRCESHPGFQDAVARGLRVMKKR
jgi:hypothetical protein